MKIRYDYTKTGEVRLYINEIKVNQLFPNNTAAERYVQQLQEKQNNKAKGTITRPPGHKKIRG